MIDEYKDCKHYIVKLEGKTESLDDKLLLGNCINCKQLIQINEEYKLIPTGLYNLYKKVEIK